MLEAKEDNCTLDAAFWEHMKLGHFAATCDTNMPPAVASPYGCVGRYGLGYGPEEHRKTLKETYGIGNSDRKGPFQAPEWGLWLFFWIRNVEEYQCFSQFAKAHDYAIPPLSLAKKKGALKAEMAAEWEQTLQQNEAKKAEVAALVQQLENHAAFSFEQEPEVYLEDTDRFYEWAEEPSFPQRFQIVERDKLRAKQIWIDSGLVQYCKPGWG